jgi:hypothetical protein
VFLQQRVLVVPRPDYVFAAALGEFDDSVPRPQVQAVPLQAFACPQSQADGVVLHAPGARKAVETRGFGPQPVLVSTVAPAGAAARTVG